MSWSERLSTRIARRLVSATSTTHTVGQVSHGVEIFVLYVLTILTLVVCSWFLHTFVETTLLSFCYFLYRNFTGGVHLRSPQACFIAGNIFVLTLGLVAKYLPTSSMLFSTLFVAIMFTFALLVNRKYAPANHTYVEIDDEQKRKSKKIVIRLLILGCLISYILLYFSYYNIAFALSLSVMLQAFLLLPFSFHLVKCFEKLYYEKGLNGND